MRELPANESAARAGLKLDDEIVEIDGRPVLEMDAADISRALRGPVGTTVTLVVLRKSGRFEIKIERGPVYTLPQPAPDAGES